MTVSNISLPNTSGTRCPRTCSLVLFRIFNRSLVFAQLLFMLFSVANVAYDLGRAEYCSARILNGGDTQGHPYLFSCFCDANRFIVLNALTRLDSLKNIALL